MLPAGAQVKSVGYHFPTGVFTPSLLSVKLCGLTRLNIFGFIKLNPFDLICMHPSSPALGIATGSTTCGFLTGIFESDHPAFGVFAQLISNRGRLYLVSRCAS